LCRYHEYYPNKKGYHVVAGICGVRILQVKFFNRNAIYVPKKGACNFYQLKKVAEQKQIAEIIIQYTHMLSLISFIMRMAIFSAVVSKLLSA
jgi:hypothetical protein